MGATSNPTNAQIAAYVRGNEELITVVGVGKSTFDRFFGSPATSSTNLYATFTAALNAASQKINEGLTASPNIRNVRELKTEVARISTQINTLAQERQDELKGAGLGDDAGTLQDAVGVQRKQQVRDDLASKCTLWGWNISICINEGITWLIKNTLLQIAGFLVWLTANMFNYSVQLGILEFSKWAAPGLYSVWIIVRQIISLIIVFVGLYLGFMYIIGKQDTFAHYIPWVVIFAIFVNFSYPLTRLAIDVSNIVSLNIYTSTVGNEVLNPGGYSSQNTAGALIMNKLGLNGLMASATSVKDNDGAILGQINSIPGALLAVCYALYAAYIFFIATALIIGRIVALVFITIASPLLLVDSVLPVLGEKAKELRKIFFEQLAVAPVFMVMLALTLRFLDVFSLSSGGGLAGASGTTPIVTFFNILMMLIMLHIMITVTKKTAGTVGTFAAEKLGQVGGFGLGVAAGGAGLLGRHTVGRFAARVQNSDWVNKNKDTMLGRAASRMSGSIATGSFDLRNSKTVAGAANKMGALGLKTGLMGAMGGGGGSGGFTSALHARKKRDDEMEKSVKRRYKIDTVDDDGVFHKAGEVDQKATEETKRRFNENRSNSVFYTKEMKLEMRDEETKKIEATKMAEYKKTKGGKERDAKLAEFEGALQELRKTDVALESAEASALQKTITAIKKDIADRKNSGTAYSEALSEYMRFDDSPDGDAKKIEYLGKNPEFKEYILKKEGEKKAKEEDDKRYRQEALQANKDLATGFKALSGTGSGRDTSGATMPIQGSRVIQQESPIDTSELDDAGFVDQNNHQVPKSKKDDDLSGEGTSTPEVKPKPPVSRSAAVPDEPLEDISMQNFAARAEKRRKVRQEANAEQYGLTGPEGKLPPLQPSARAGLADGALSQTTPSPARTRNAATPTTTVSPPVPSEKTPEEIRKEKQAANAELFGLNKQGGTSEGSMTGATTTPDVNATSAGTSTAPSGATKSQQPTTV